jgi:hypothetical protein
MSLPLWVSLPILGCFVASGAYMGWLIKKNPSATPWSDDEESSALLSATIENWPSKNELAAWLNEVGIETLMGEHAIRIAACSSFVFRDFDGAESPSLTGDHESVETLRYITEKVSDVLKRKDVRHRFEVYDDSGALHTTYKY